jgi:hypothetical protein
MAVYRNDETLARIRRMFWLFGIVGLGVGVVGLTRFFSGATNALGGSVSVLIAVLGSIGVLMMRRTDHVAIETDQGGLVVRNLLSTRRLSWGDISVFEEGRRRGITLASVRMQDGSVHALSACGDPGPTCTKMLAKLSKELKASRRS